MTHLKFIDGRSAYREVLRHVHETGRPRSPRGLKTYDAGYTTIELLFPYDALPLDLGRRLSRRIAAAEAVQLIGAFSQPQLLTEASTNFSRYVEPDGRFWGAYGRRIGNQLTSAVGKLREDPDTRQAVISLWDAELDNRPGKLDYPCTLTLGLSIRDERVELDVTMRSNDVWRGLPYDMFQFTQLQLTVANVLARQPGRYRHHTYSLHLYDDDVTAARDVYESITEPAELPQPTGFGAPPRMSLFDTMFRARAIVDPDFTRLDCLDDSERWYWDALHPAE